MIGTADDLADRPGDVEPVDAGQAEVEHDQVGDDGADQPQRLLARSCRRHPVPGVDEVVPDDLDDGRLVVDDEHVSHRGDHASVAAPAAWRPACVPAAVAASAGPAVRRLRHLGLLVGVRRLVPVAQLGLAPRHGRPSGHGGTLNSRIRPTMTSGKNRNPNPSRAVPQRPCASRATTDGAASPSSPTTSRDPRRDAGTRAVVARRCGKRRRRTTTSAATPAGRHADAGHPVPVHARCSSPRRGMATTI